MKELDQPSIEFQRELNSICSAIPDKIRFHGRNVKIHWIHYGTERKFSDVMLREKNAHKRNVKLCSILLLNSKWRILFFYWFIWRWYYYIVDLDEVEVLKVINASKKKIQSEASMITTTLAIGMMDTMMTMKKEEVKLTQVGQHGEQDTP